MVLWETHRVGSMESNQGCPNGKTRFLRGRTRLPRCPQSLCPWLQVSGQEILWEMPLCSFSIPFPSREIPHFPYKAGGEPPHGGCGIPGAGWALILIPGFSGFMNPKSGIFTPDPPVGGLGMFGGRERKAGGSRDSRLLEAGGWALMR